MSGGQRLKGGRVLHKYAVSVAYSSLPIIRRVFCQTMPENSLDESLDNEAGDMQPDS